MRIVDSPCPTGRRGWSIVPVCRTGRYGERGRGKYGLFLFSLFFFLFSSAAQAVTPLIAPTLTATFDSSTSVILHWNDPNDAEAGYAIEQAPGSSADFVKLITTPKNAANFAITGLTKAAIYRFRIRAVGQDGEYSTYSTIIEMNLFQTDTTSPSQELTQDIGTLSVPIAPSNLFATASGSTINLTWTDNSTNEDSFRIWIATNGSLSLYKNIDFVSANVTSYSCRGLLAGKNYFFKVDATNASGSTFGTNRASATALTSDTVSLAPNNLSVTFINQNSISVSWTDNSNNELGFKIERSSSQSGPFSAIGNTSISMSRTAYTVFFQEIPSGLVGGATYYYRVAAYNEVGTSSYVSKPLVMPSLDPPPSPSNFTATVLLDSLGIGLLWTVTSDNAGYRISKATSTSGPFNLFFDLGPISAEIGSAMGLEDAGPFTSGATYYYRIVAYNAVGESSVVAASAKYPFPPPTPMNVTIQKIYPTEIDLAWTKTTDAIGYSVERSLSSSSGFVEINRMGQGSILFPSRNLNPNTTYYYRVRSYNGAGYSAYSPVVSATTLATPTIADASGSWLIILTHRGTAIPNGAVSFLCSTSASPNLISSVSTWMKTETNKYGIARPFSSLSCVTSEQVSIPSTYWQTTPTSEQGFPAPLDEAGVITYLTTNSAVSLSTRNLIQSAKFVTVYHYLPTSISFVQNPFGTKYSFIYFLPLDGIFYPPLTIDEYGRTHTHELMHNLGAGDKYLTTSVQACQTNPTTGQEYSGYDIMCHRIYDPREPTVGAGYTFPDFSLLAVSEPTAVEAGWVVMHPADITKDWHINIDEATAYGACYRTSCVWQTPPSPIPVDYATNAGYLWKNPTPGDTSYHYDSTKPCSDTSPQCFVSGAA